MKSVGLRACEKELALPKPLKFRVNKKAANQNGQQSCVPARQFCNLPKFTAAAGSFFKAYHHPTAQ